MSSPIIVVAVTDQKDAPSERTSFWYHPSLVPTTYSSRKSSQIKYGLRL